MTEETPITAEELQVLYGDVDLQQLFIDEIVEEYKNAYDGHLTSIIMHPDAYKTLMDFKNQNAIQRFFWEIKWGFIDCSINFKNWKGHMRGEEWDFWEILNGEWSDYE
jgi:hypothetical protein